VKLISVNVSLPREVLHKGTRVKTGIFKEPVTGRVRVRRMNLDGDRQADLSVHGGANKAIYAYPSEHYHYWRRELRQIDLPWGMFGENFTTEGLLERRVNIGDRFRVGSAELMVTQPRLPCYKLGVKFRREDMLRRFLQSGRTGFYLAVLQEGEVGAGDTIERVACDRNEISVPDITRLYVTRNYSQADLEMLHRAATLEVLPEDWRNYFAEKLQLAAERNPSA
jgi:MOSC domain-containing protein YiiM